MQSRVEAVAYDRPTWQSRFTAATPKRERGCRRDSAKKNRGRGL